MSLIDTVKNRAIGQANWNLETTEAKVTKIYFDSVGNVSECDVIVYGQSEELIRVKNASSIKWWVGATVTVNWIKGSRHAPQIIGSGPAAEVIQTANTSTDSLNLGTITNPDQASSDAYFIVDSIETELPNSKVLEAGASITLTDVNETLDSTDYVGKYIDVFLDRVDTIASLPDPSTTELRDGTLYRVGLAAATTQALYQLDKGNSQWINLSDLSGAVILAPAASTRNVIQATTTGIIPLIVKKYVGATDDLTEWQSDVGTVVAKVASDGKVYGSTLNCLGDVGAEYSITPNSSNLDFNVNHPSGAAYRFCFQGTSGSKIEYTQNMSGGNYFSGIRINTSRNAMVAAASGKTMNLSADNSGTTDPHLTISVGGRVGLHNTSPNALLHPIGRSGYPVSIFQLEAAQTDDILQARASDGTTILAKIDKDGKLQAAGYKSSDGTSGASTSTGGLVFKDGLYVSGSISGSITDAVILAPAASTRNVVQATTTGIVPLTLKRYTGAIDSLIEFQSDAGSVIAKVDKDGIIQPAGYKSSDGTAGASATTGGVTFKDGLYTGGTITPGGSGTVTSVSLTAPSSILTVTGSPVTTSGTLALTLANQTANRVFAGPTTGSAAAPTFRALVAADIPSITLAKISDAGTAASRNVPSSGNATSTQVVLGNDKRILSRSLVVGNLTLSDGETYLVCLLPHIDASATNSWNPRSLEFYCLDAPTTGQAQMHVRFAGGNLLSSPAVIDIGNTSMAGQIVTFDGSTGPWTAGTLFEIYCVQNGGSGRWLIQLEILATVS